MSILWLALLFWLSWTLPGPSNLSLMYTALQKELTLDLHDVSLDIGDLDIDFAKIFTYLGTNTHTSIELFQINAEVIGGVLQIGNVLFHASNVLLDLNKLLIYFGEPLLHLCLKVRDRASE